MPSLGMATLLITQTRRIRKETELGISFYLDKRTVRSMYRLIYWELASTLLDKLDEAGIWRECVLGMKQFFDKLERFQWHHQSTKLPILLDKLAGRYPTSNYRSELFHLDNQAFVKKAILRL